MGCCCSVPVPSDDSIINVAKKCNFTSSDLEKLWKKFKSYDVLGDSKITVDEFVICTREGEEHDMFLRLVFLLFDQTMSGSLKFDQFLLAMYHFMSLEKNDLSLFTFEIFDLNGTDHLGADEVEFMVSVLWGPKEGPNKLKVFKSLMKETNKNISDGIKGTDFLQICAHMPNIMFPAFSVQQSLREQSLGSSRWRALTDERKKLMKSVKFHNIQEIDSIERKGLHGYAFLALKSVNPTEMPRSIQLKIEEAEQAVEAMKKRNAFSKSLDGVVHVKHHKDSSHNHEEALHNAGHGHHGHADVVPGHAHVLVKGEVGLSSSHHDAHAGHVGHVAHVGHVHTPHSLSQAGAQAHAHVQILAAHGKGLDNHDSDKASHHRGNEHHSARHSVKSHSHGHSSHKIAVEE